MRQRCQRGPASSGLARWKLRALAAAVTLCEPKRARRWPAGDLRVVADSGAVSCAGYVVPVAELCDDCRRLAVGNRRAALPDTMEGQGLLLSQPLWIANSVRWLRRAFGRCLDGRSASGLKTAPVEGELRSLPPADSDDELAKLVRQALLTYEEAVASPRSMKRPKRRRVATREKIGRFGKRWQDIETQAKKQSRTAHRPQNELRNRIDSSSDESISSGIHPRSRCDRRAAKLPR